MVLSTFYLLLVPVIFLLSKIVQAQTTAHYEASFLFQVTSCYVTPIFELGCSGGGTIAGAKVEMSDDTPGSVTCILHPTKGDQYRRCTASVTSSGQGVQTSLFSASFRCEGTSSDLLSATTSTAPTVAQCTPSDGSERRVFHYTSLSVYDWVNDSAIDAGVCELGALELVSDPDLGSGCSQLDRGCDEGALRDGGCSVQLEPTLLNLEGSDLPVGAIQNAAPTMEESTRKGHVAVWVIVAVATACIVACAVAYFRHRTAKNEQQEKDADDNTVQVVGSTGNTLSQRSLPTVSQGEPSFQVSCSKAAGKSPSKQQRSSVEVDANDIQKYGFSVIRNHLNGADSSD